MQISHYLSILFMSLTLVSLIPESGVAEREQVQIRTVQQGDRLLITNGSPERILLKRQSDAADVVKWCSSENASIRYTSSNISPQGYAPCGTVQTLAYCDGLGHKFIGSGNDVPHGYVDCSFNNRIYIEKDGTPVDVQAALKDYEASYNSDPMHSKAEVADNDSAFASNGLMQALLNLGDRFGFLEGLSDENLGAGGRATPSKTDPRGKNSPTSFENLENIILPALKGNSLFKGYNELLGSDEEDNNLKLP
ncbi:hypothetical protein OAO01_06590 [Oligoflexia bacterium]|nr:hypothetical protein [Oligoflexia bacterium]